MFNLNIDKKYLYIVLAIIVAFSLADYIRNPEQLLLLVLTLPGVIIAITFHEFAHAWMANKLGDDTPRQQNRLNLNPLSHIDPFGFIMLVFAHFGWGKPVEIDPRNFNRNRSMSAQEAMVAIAGPIMNLILALIFTIIYVALSTFARAFIATNQVGIILMSIIYMAIIVNIGLGVFNLVPLPPLDGSKVLAHFLPYNAKTWFENNEKIFYLIFLAIWITGIVNYIISPVISVVSNGMYWLVASIFNLFI